MAQLKPLGARLLVKRMDAQTTKGGIILPESAQEKPKQGTVIAVGDQNPENIQAGNQIYFSPYGGSEVKHLGEEGYLILPIDEVLCVVE